MRRSDDPLFGLHTSEHVQPGSYNVMGYIAMSAGTVGEALSKVSRYEKLVGDMGTTETRLHDEHSEILWHCRYPRQPARRHLIENVFGSWLHYTRWLTGDLKLAPGEVWFEHPGPRFLHQQREYERVFRCPVRFSRPYSALIGPRRLLDYPCASPIPRCFPPWRPTPRASWKPWASPPAWASACASAWRRLWAVGACRTATRWPVPCA